MFNARYFPNRYFAKTYWPNVGATIVAGNPPYYGTLTISPLYSGTMVIAALYSGITAITSRYSGSMEIKA